MSRKGFASWDPEKLRAVASKGGLAAHAQGVAHEFTSEEAREAGKIGGKKVASDRAHMAELGRKGGKALAEKVSGERSSGKEKGQATQDD